MKEECCRDARQVFEFGTDTFLPRDGKMTAETFGAMVTPKS